MIVGLAIRHPESHRYHIQERGSARQALAPMVVTHMKPQLVYAGCEVVTFNQGAVDAAVFVSHYRAQAPPLRTLLDQQLDVDCAVALKARQSTLAPLDLSEHVAAGAQVVANRIRAVSHDLAIREVVMANYFEAVAEFVAGGRSSIYAFIAQCVRELFPR